MCAVRWKSARAEGLKVVPRCSFRFGVGRPSCAAIRNFNDRVA